MYIEKLLLYLRQHQSILYKILIKADDSQKQSLAILVSEFMYDNIFRSDSIQEELLIMLYRTLKNEIQNLKHKSKPNEFLKGSINAFILESLVKNQDIKTYFGNLILKLSDLMESFEDIKEIMFDLKSLNVPTTLVRKLKMDCLQDLCGAVLTYCLYLIILDIIENNVTFVLPMHKNGVRKANISVKCIDGERFQKMYQKGSFQGILSYRGRKDQDVLFCLLF